MGWFDRMSTLLKANLNHMIERHEDPERLLNQLIADMKSHMVQAKREVASVIAHEKRLKRQHQATLETAKSWEKKAMMAVRAGRDDLAKEALRRKAEQDTLAEEFQAQWEAQKAAADKLRAALRGLDQKIRDANVRKRQLIARKNRIEAQANIQRAMNAMSQTDPSSRFVAFEQRIEQAEAELEAEQELMADAQDADLEAQFTSLQEDHSADAALAALKAQMGVVEEVTFEQEEEAQAFSFEVAKAAKARKLKASS